MPKKLLPLIAGPWHAEQPVVMPLCVNLAPAKVVMLPLAPLKGISVAGTLPAWQVSQASVVGTCTGVRLAMVLGTTPKKVPVVTLAPWQLAQPVLMPLWLKAELPKLAPVCTGRLRLEPAPTWQLSQPSAPMAIWLLGGAMILLVMAWL